MKRAKADKAGFEILLRDDKAGCVAGVIDGNDADKRELEEIIEEYLADQEGGE